MTPREVLAESVVPSTNESVYFLGCFASRVTVYAQQIRALNLVDALLAEKIIGPGGRIAIVGGGAAGITAAAALGKYCPALNAIDIYEARSSLMHLQNRHSDRFLHPHLYDWPAPGSDNPEAGLPVLNWNAGTAGDVAAAILAEFGEIRKQANQIRVCEHQTVLRVEPQRYVGCRVVTASTPNQGVEYDAVIIAIGFGYERPVSQLNPSYWVTSQLTGDIPSPKNFHNIFISGNGDGGLVEFQMAAFNGLTHGAICKHITGVQEWEDVRSLLLEIEEEAWSRNDFDIYGAYEDRIVRALRSNRGALLRVGERLRPNATILLHTRNRYLFRRDTAVLNRFGAFLAILADRNRGNDRIGISVGKAFVGDIPLTGPVRIEGEPEYEPSYRFLRLGAEREENFAPFQRLVEVYREAHRNDILNGYRPATPSLTDSAVKRFGTTPSPQLPQKVQTTSTEGILPNLDADSLKQIVEQQTASHARPNDLGEQALQSIRERQVPNAAPDSPVRAPGSTNDLAQAATAAHRYAMNPVLPKLLAHGIPVSWSIPMSAVGIFATRPQAEDASGDAGEQVNHAEVPSEPRPAPSSTDQERDLAEQAAKHWLNEISELRKQWELHAAVDAAAKAEVWLSNHEADLSPSTLSTLYELLVQVETDRVSRARIDGSRPDLSKARDLLSKAKNAKSRTAH